MGRSVKSRYLDPLEEVWLACAHRLGLLVRRSDDAFAHSTGHGELHVATSRHLDQDDCLAQMIFHELCHSLVEGEQSFEKVDWGLNNTSESDDFREHATLRLQAFLLAPYGLQLVLAPTTDFRSFYDGIFNYPLEGPTLETKLARHAIRRSRQSPWWPHLQKALQNTRTITACVQDSYAPGPLPTLSKLLQPELAPHPLGDFLRGNEVCGDCAWHDEEEHCQHFSEKTPNNTPACRRFEAEIDCLTCGACCSEAYHSVILAPHDRTASAHPSLVDEHSNYTEMKRHKGRCVALKRDVSVEQGQPEARFLCVIYEDRPTCCRDFENAGPNCVVARRRLGFSL